MAIILHLETATRVCSVAVSDQDRLLSLREENSPDYSHSRLLNQFVDEALSQVGVSYSQLDAVAVSSGPGSYTGLRIGSSAAKGFCYALDIPLIAVDTLKAMAHNCFDEVCGAESYLPCAALQVLFCPMIDARRMEVYYGLFDACIHSLKETRAEVITEDSFSRLLEDNKVFFFGDGAAKCRPFLTSYNARVLPDILPSARGMIKPAWEKFSGGKFEDVAYFEPFYMKEFLAGAPRVKGLRQH